MASKYQEIITSLINQIETGKLSKGDRIPSIRSLSRTFHCSKDTALRALLELKYQNYIYAVEKVAIMSLKTNNRKKRP